MSSLTSLGQLAPGSDPRASADRGSRFAESPRMRIAASRTTPTSSTDYYGAAAAASTHALSDIAERAPQRLLIEDPSREPPRQHWALRPSRAPRSATRSAP